MKFLIIGLGNPGVDYKDTRHNLGFKVLDKWAEDENLVFEHTRYSFRTVASHKGRKFILIKPTTYVNLSGKAVNYWLKKERIPPERMMIIVDDVSLAFGTIRIKAKGGDAGHNGVANINQVLGHQNYPRLRFGIGGQFHKGEQVRYVLSEWSGEEKSALDERLDKVIEAVKSFGLIGLERTMNYYNGK